MATACDVDAIGKEFAAGYYNAFVAKPGATTAGDYYDDKSKFVFLQHGRRPDFEARGADEIGRFAGRMNYGECTVRLVSVDTIKVHRRAPGWFAVLTVGTLARPGVPLPRKFVQSTVIRYAPSSERTFSVVGTVFKFDDSMVDHGVFAPDDVESTENAASENRRSDDDDDDDDSGGRPVDAAAVVDPLTSERDDEPKPSVEDDPEDSADADDESKGSTTAASSTTSSLTAVEREPETCGSAGKSKVKAPIRQLYVRGFPNHVRVEDLKTLFGKFDTLTEVEIFQCPKRAARPTTRKYAIVRFENPEWVDVVAGMKTVLMETGDRVIVEKSTRK